MDLSGNQTAGRPKKDPAPLDEAVLGVHSMSEPFHQVLEVFSSLGDAAKGACPQHPGFVVSKYFAKDRVEQVMTYGEVYQNILKMARIYRDMGMGPGSKIALAETNSLDFFAGYFGGLAVGATMVPINLLALQDESVKATCLAHMLSTPRLDAKDKPGADLFVLGDDPLFQKMRGLDKILALKKKAWLFRLLAPSIQRFASNQRLQGLDPLVFSLLGKSAKTPREKADLGVFFESLPSGMRLMLPEEREALLDKAQPLRQDECAKMKGDSIADILYTSGTSGNPKGVALTQDNLAFTLASLTQGTEGMIQPDEVLLMGLPFFHIFGKVVMLTALSRQLVSSAAGGKIQMILLPSLSKAITNLDGVLKTIEDYGVTLMPSVPIFLEKMVEYLKRHPQKQPMVSSLRVIISGGAALKRELYEDLNVLIPGCRVMEGYGSSEGGINLLNIPAVPGFVGFALPGVNTRLETAPGGFPNEGELWVRSPGVSAGYVEGTTSGADTVIADPDGWFHTGDVVRIDPLHGMKIIGRQSFFIKIDNEKRSPQEIEDAVRQADDSILEVMAIPHLAGTPSECVVAVVITPNRELDEAALKKAMDHLASKNHITRWKIPKHMVVLHLETIPTRFNNGFKREAGYKVVRQFVTALLMPQGDFDKPAVVFHPKSTTVKREWTEILDPDALARTLQPYL